MYKKRFVYIFSLIIFLLLIITNIQVVHAEKSLDLATNSFGSNENEDESVLPYDSDFSKKLDNSSMVNLKEGQIEKQLNSMKVESTTSDPVIDVPGDSVTVDDWTQFVDASKKVSVGKIIIGKNLTAANNNVSFQNDKIVLFNGNSINMGGRYLNTNSYKINFVDASISSTGSRMMAPSANSTIIFSGIGQLQGSIVNTSNNYSQLRFNNANYSVKNSSSNAVVDFEGRQGSDLYITNSTITDNSRSFYYSTSTDNISKKLL